MGCLLENGIFQFSLSFSPATLPSSRSQRTTFDVPLARSVESPPLNLSQILDWRHRRYIYETRKDRRIVGKMINIETIVLVIKLAIIRLISPEYIYTIHTAQT